MSALPRPSLVDEATAALEAMFTLPGREYGPSLQIAHNLKCLKRATYDDNDGVRLRRHVLVYGPKGFAKSSSTKYFLTKLAGAVDPLTNDGAAALRKGDHPRFSAWKNGAGMERLRGTVDMTGMPLDPLLQSIDWLYSPELMGTLGHAPQTRGDRMDMLNGWLEEGDVNVILTKASNMPVEERREVARQLRAAGKPYFYDPETCAISYNCHFSFLGCTRYLNEKVIDELLASGYWERHSITELRPTRTQMGKYANQKFGEGLDSKRIADIKQRNLDLWRTKFKTVNMPPKELVRKAVEHYNDRLRQVCENLGADFNQEISGRDDLDIIHLITASAVDRISMSRAPGDVSPVEKLEYSEEDAKRAIEWSTSKLMHIHSRLTAKASAEKAEALGASDIAIRTYVDSGADRTFTHRAFVDVLIGKGIPRTTAYRHFKTLLQVSAIAPAPGEPDKYHLDEATVERVMSAPAPATVAPTSVKLAASSRKSSEPTVRFKTPTVPTQSAASATTAAPAPPVAQKPVPKGPIKAAVLPVAKREVADDDDGDDGDSFSSIAAQFKPWE